MQPNSLAGPLLTRQLRSGGWSYFGSQQSSVEATSLAVMALSTESPNAARSGLDQMLDLQRRDGAWPAFVGDSEASWTTALALCALNGTGEFTSAREKAFHWLVAERGREAHWLWRWKFKTTDRNVRFESGQVWLALDLRIRKLGHPHGVQHHSHQAIHGLQSLRGDRRSESIWASRCFWIAPVLTEVGTRETASCTGCRYALI